MLFLIGLGLSCRDLSINALECLKHCSKAYLENYTSLLPCALEELESLTGLKVQPVKREFVEDGESLLGEAARENVALIVVGDVFTATTHAALYLEAVKKGVPVKVFHNASVMTAVSITGLELYKFGRTTSIPFKNERVDTPYRVLRENQRLGLHTLLLLDLDVENEKFMTVWDALNYLLSKGFGEGELCVGCARLGRDDFKVKAGSAEELLKADFGEPPHCLVVPGKLHFLEEEALKLWMR